MKSLILSAAVFLSVFSVYAGEKVVIRSDLWEPFNGDPKSATPGFAIEIARIVFEKAGYELDYQAEGWTWERSIEEAKKGNIDGIVGAFKEDAPGFVFPDENLGMSASTFYVKKGNTWKYSDMESLKTVSLGVISGYSYGDPLDSYVSEESKKGEAVQSVDDENGLELNIRKLLAGRIDVLIEDYLVLKSKAVQMGVDDQIEAAGQLSDPEPVYMTFTPARESSKKLAEILTSGIRELRQSGELQKILDKYGIKDWQTP